MYSGRHHHQWCPVTRCDTLDNLRARASPILSHPPATAMAFESALAVAGPAAQPQQNAALMASATADAEAEAYPAVPTDVQQGRGYFAGIALSCMGAPWLLAAF